MKCFVFLNLKTILQKDGDNKKTSLLFSVFLADIFRLDRVQGRYYYHIFDWKALQGQLFDVIYLYSNPTKMEREVVLREATLLIDIV